MAVKKKSRPLGTSPNFTKKSVSGRGRFKTVEFVAIGADISTTSISLAGIAKTSDGKTRTGATAMRWERGTDYFVRMKEAAKAHDIVITLFEEMKVMPDLSDVHFACEEPISFGHLQRKESSTIKQQCQISGAFIGGLLRWGWLNIYEIQANAWRKIVADDLAAKHGIDFTIHKSKFGSTDVLPLPKGFRAHPKNVGKYRAQQWIMELHPKWDGHWPDLISHSKRGMIHRPDDSNALGQQCDDRYESFAMAEWMKNEIKRGK